MPFSYSPTLKDPTATEGKSKFILRFVGGVGVWMCLWLTVVLLFTSLETDSHSCGLLFSTICHLVGEKYSILVSAVSESTIRIFQQTCTAFRQILCFTFISLRKFHSFGSWRSFLFYTHAGCCGWADVVATLAPWSRFEKVLRWFPQLEIWYFRNKSGRYFHTEYSECTRDQLRNAIAQF